MQKCQDCDLLYMCLESITISTEGNRWPCGLQSNDPTLYNIEIVNNLDALEE